MKKLDKYILYFIFYIPLILLFGYFFYQVCFGERREELIIDRDLNEGFNGNVDSLYQDKRNHNVKICIISNGYRYEIPPLWESKIEKGDSLIKKRGSLKLSIYKRNKKNITLDYQDIYKRSLISP
ncbi:hypothetical protein DHW03_03280 [Pedobacter yonginense]|uniref:Uncharacterized protein n=1 Tax=Pedobacter yonginense TaxID=651869 RepID=A0A317EPP2_9SPHI|nr:hypothetical protein [Pedobacter yonginense]PWS28870.1 hypothetical protein DHW03_03280 [Pedobacter yonginense]